MNLARDADYLPPLKHLFRVFQRSSAAGCGLSGSHGFSLPFTQSPRNFLTSIVRTFVTTW